MAPRIFAPIYGSSTSLGNSILIHPLVAHKRRCMLSPGRTWTDDSSRPTHGAARTVSAILTAPTFVGGRPFILDPGAPDAFWHSFPAPRRGSCGLFLQFLISISSLRHRNRIKRIIG